MTEEIESIWEEINLESITYKSDLDPLRVRTYLKKLKTHIDWLQSYIDANKLITDQFAFHDDRYWWNSVDLTEMEEKAEKWDLADKIGPPPHGDKRIQWHIDMSELRLKLEAVKAHLESYPDEKNDEIYCITRHYPSTAGPHVFNSVLFLTHLETWHKQLKELLEETV